MHETKQMYPVQKKMGSVSNSDRKKLSLSSLQNTGIKIIASAAATTIIGNELIKLTLEQRGYFAIGGEWIAMMFFFYGFYRILSLNKKSHPLIKTWKAPRQGNYTMSDKWIQGDNK